MEKVSRIKNYVLNGNFFISPRELADSTKQIVISPNSNLKQNTSSSQTLIDTSFHKAVVTKPKKLKVSQVYVKVKTDSTISTSRYFYKSFSQSDSAYSGRSFLAYPYQHDNKGNFAGDFINDNQIPVSGYAISIPHKINEIPFNGNNNNWLVGIIMLSILILAFVKISYEKYFKQYIDSIFNSHLANKMFHDRNVFSRRVSIFLTFTFILSFGLFIYEILKFYRIKSFEIPEILKFLIITTILMLFYILIQITTSVWGSIFMTKKEFILYRHNFNLFSKNMGVFLMPLVISIPFVADSAKNVLFVFGGVIFSGFYLLRIFRGFKIVVSKRVSFLYLILYLCAFEIFPILILYKIYNMLA